MRCPTKLAPLVVAAGVALSATTPLASATVTTAAPAPIMTPVQKRSLLSNRARALGRSSRSAHRAARAAHAAPRPVALVTHTAHASGTGWRASLSRPESLIIQHESGFSPTAQNPSSTAFGLGQLLLGVRVVYGRALGVDPNTTNPYSQLKMFRMYIKHRYGDAEHAWEHWIVHSWY